MSLTDHEYDFFISYSNADTDLVSSIVESLENDYKAKCWFQEKDSKAEFIDEIMSGIENSKVFILFISEHSANSYFVLNEINHATEWRCQNEDYKIIPIIIDKTKQDVADAAYKRVRFYLGRLNILNANTFDSIDSLILKIFEQAEIDLPDRSLHKSLYHSSESENARLCAQNEILRNFSSEFFTKYTTPDSYILDIGCASGENIILRLEGIAYTALLGLDIDEKQVECATNRFGDNKNTFLKCDVMSPELDDILEDYMERNDIIGFDVIHISAVLLHLDDPLDLLRRLRRYLKKPESCSYKMRTTEPISYIQIPNFSIVHLKYGQIPKKAATGSAEGKYPPICRLPDINIVIWQSAEFQTLRSQKISIRHCGTFISIIIFGLPLKKICFAIQTKPLSC